MSKSLEALKNRIATLRCNNRIGSRDIANQEILEIAMFLENHIVKDLEAYEQLKQDYDKTLINNGELCVKVCKLENENQELKEWNKKYLSELERWGYPETPIHISKYKKLTKAIEILESVLDLDLENSEVWGKLTYFINSNGGSSLTKETYDFLKEFINEVLENE